MLTQEEIKLDELNEEHSYNLDEFFELLGDEVENYELIGGKIVARENPGPGAQHAEIVTKIATQLEIFANASANRLGKVFSGPACTLGRPKGSNWLIPDVAFVLIDRLPTKFSGPLPVAPDLVVEINSPSDTLERIHDKITQYAEAGVNLVWSVYPLDKFVLVHRPNAPELSFVPLDGYLDGETVLPGFKLVITALFD